jgi:hypothetical protein
MKTYKCLSCNKENLFGHSKSNKYCNNQCQKDYEYKKFITEWKQGVQDGVNKNAPSKHLYRYILEKQESKCLLCGISSYNGLPLILELDHKDGNHTNNTEKNLRCLCPNCHSQTDTYKNRNLGKGRKLRSK